MSHRLTSRLVSRLSPHVRAHTPTPPAAVTCAVRHLSRYVKKRVWGVRLWCGTWFLGNAARPTRLGGMACGNSISARTLSFAAIIIYGKILERSHTDSGATSILSSQTIVPYSALAVLKKSTSFSRAQYGSVVRYSQLNIPVSPVSNRTLTLQLPQGAASVTKCSCSIMPTPFSAKAVRSLAE